MNDLPLEDPQFYKVFFPNTVGSVELPVKGFWGWVTICIKLRIHFVHHYMWYMLVILDLGNLPHPQCPDCNVLLP